MAQIVIEETNLAVAVLNEGIQIVAPEEQVTVEDVNQQLVLTVEDTETRIVTVSEPGPQGIPGEKGDPGGIYVHEQSTPVSTWTVNHNLNIYPVPQIVDSSGNTVEGDITYVSADTLTVTFSSAFAGKIYLAY